MKNKKTILLIISALLLSVIGCGDGMTPQEREAANAQRSSAAELGHPIESTTENSRRNPENRTREMLRWNSAFGSWNDAVAHQIFHKRSIYLWQNCTEKMDKSGSSEILWKSVLPFFRTVPLESSCSS